MSKLIAKFLIRWLANGLGLVAAAKLFGLVDYDSITTVIVGGLILSFLNAFIKPIIVILTLPAIALTLGIFMIVINGLIVYLAGALYGALEVNSFWNAILAGIIIGLVNYIITIVSEKAGK